MYKIRIISAALILLLLVSSGYSFDQAKFDSLMSDIQEKEYTKVEKFLNENEDSLKDDPEYYVLLLNYVLSKGDKSGLVVAQGTAKEDDIILKDPATDRGGG